MRIAFARRGYSSTGGAEAYLHRLMQRLANCGEEIVLYSSNEWPLQACPYVDLYHIPGDTPLQFAHALRSRKRDFDFLFSLERVWECDIYRAGDGVHASWLHRRKQFEPTWKSWLRYFSGRKHMEILELEQCVFNPSCTELIIVNSRMVQEEILEYYEFPKERICLIPNGFQPQPVSRDTRMYIRKQYGLSSDEIVILFVGTGWERKGLRFAVQAVRALRGGCAKLLVVGKGPLKKYTSPNTIFTGAVSPIAPLYAAADIFLLPTIYDPSSNACLEALASGLPVITTFANGFSEILENDALGNAVEVGNVESLVTVLEQWLPQKRRHSSRCERLKVAAEFSMEQNVHKTLEAIRLAVSKKHQVVTK